MMAFNILTTVTGKSMQLILPVLKVPNEKSKLSYFKFKIAEYQFKQEVPGSTSSTTSDHIHMELTANISRMRKSDPVY